MILSLIIIVLLILAFKYGLKRGLLGSTITLLYAVVFILSIFLATPIANFFTNMTNSDSTSMTLMIFYKILAFWVVTIAGGIVVRVIANISKSFTKLPIISQINAILGGIITTIIMYIMIFLGILVLTNWPDQSVRQTVQTSSVATYILNNTTKITDNLLYDE